MLLYVSLTEFMIGWPHVHFVISPVFSVCLFFNCMIFHSAYTFWNTYVIAEIAVILIALKSILNAITADAIVLSFHNIDVFILFFFFFFTLQFWIYLFKCVTCKQHEGGNIFIQSENFCYLAETFILLTVTCDVSGLNAPLVVVLIGALI